MHIGHKRISVSLRSLLLLTLVLIFVAPARSQTSPAAISGHIKDQNGANLAGAEVALVHSYQAVLRRTVSDASGNFQFDNVAPGTYEVLISQTGFATHRVPAEVGSGRTTVVEVILEPMPLSSQVTVTAETGLVLDKDRVPQALNIISQSSITQRVTTVLAQAADEEVGLNVQRTSPTMGEIFVRGLTGKNVPVYIDGVRYTTSTQRGGVSTFFNLNDPGSLRAMEVLRGPNGTQYGSDSLGGVVQLVSRTPVFGSEQREIHGDLNTFFTSADLSFGSSASLSYGTRRFGFFGTATGRRVNTTRSADGLDGHAAVTRFLGIPSTVFGTRLPDTAFTQYGTTAHLNFAPSDDQQFVLHYQRGQQDGGKRYDQLLGGDGNNIADLRNLMNDFFYGRYLKQGASIFDNASVTFSYNDQREERVNQGGQGLITGDITHQYEKTRVFGISGFVDKQVGDRNTLLIGGDVYSERVTAPAFTVNPVTRSSTASRPRVPDGARYTISGVYFQDVFDAIRDKLRFSGALRFSHASYESRASNSPLVGGKPLWPDDNLTAQDLSGRFGMVITPVRSVNIAFNYSRGFRAPNITDLGTLGLTGDGFEADFTSAAALNGTVGTSAGADAVSTGIPVSKQESEISNNFDVSFRFRRRRFETSVTWFLIDINQAIVKQALILPPGAVGKTIGGQPIISQNANGAVFVSLSTAPVLIRENFTDARLNGWEFSFEGRPHEDWQLGGNYTYIHARDKQTGLPPNIEGGTPPPTGFLRLRYQPGGSRFWIEGYSTLADRQNRLSSLDLGDRRTGATRTRGQIANFFNRGARVRGLIGPGPDGIAGNADDRLLATNETVAQVQTRVLGSANSAPLFTYLPGYGLLNVRGGIRFNERHEFSLDFENITDQAHRNPSWGIDGSGRSITTRYSYRF